MIFDLHCGTAPLLISCPHAGTEIPPEIAARMQPAALATPDTDWFVDRLYAFAKRLGASMIVPRYSRYVIDLNRAPDGHALYPGQRETGLVPLISFADQDLYREGQAPDAAEVASRISNYWRPYHQAIADELARMRQQHTQVALWDAHSILSEVPMFFSGRLPDLNLGTASSTSCAIELELALEEAMASQDQFTWVANGRFKGGYITRHFGQPKQGVHAIQMEMAQSCYMDEVPPRWNDEKAQHAQHVLERLLATLLERLDIGR